jgi:S1-C subfamily serine protease
MQKIFKKAGIAVGLFVAITYANFIAPQTHNSYLRYEVGESVVQVLAPSLRGGGTGFAVKGASGDNYIMTNKHVCEVAVNGYVLIKKDTNQPIYKKVIYKDDLHDLCLIQGDRRFSALDIGSQPRRGDLHYVVGHPGLRQLTVAQGEYIGYADVRLLDQVKTRKECKGQLIELTPMQQFFFGMEFVCVKTYRSFATTATTYPGNSGSPVVNKWGNVIGVLFAGSSEQEKDNYLVPLSEVKRVLSKF